VSKRQRVCFGGKGSFLEAEGVYEAKGLSRKQKVRV